jgi:type II restriction/modification system DNA methylase subunit YeeA
LNDISLLAVYNSFITQNPIRESHLMNITPQDFVAKWKQVSARERQICQEHFLDLCHMIGHPTPLEYDPTGTRFAFEMGAGKTSGGQGWADVAKMGFFGWEYKGKDHDLDKAYEQLLRYRDSLQNPPVLVVSDINRIIIRTNFTNLPTQKYELSLEDLLKPESLKILRSVFFAPEELKPRETVAGVTEKAADQFARLAGILRRYGDDPQQVAHFLIRLLFCLFAEDTGLLPERLFPRLLEQTRRNPADFAAVLRQLFMAMKDGGFFGADRILHFNGGLFDDDLALQLDGDALQTIAAIDNLDWSAIEPSIFGTLFERGLDPAKRSQLGAHYTSREDILLIVEPVLMAPLHREWETLKTECTTLKEAASGESEKKRAAVSRSIGEKLRAFADRIAAVRVLDAACGSGNFLYIALRLLLDLQNEVISFSDQLGAGRFFISVSPIQLYGIEINEYAHELAQVTIQIGYIQWLVSNGYGLPSEPILKRMDNIRQMDAILAYDAEGKPVEPEWPEADVIIGNPPFLGNRKMRPELGTKYCDDLLQVYGDRINGMPDLVCYWFEIAHNSISESRAKRVGLLATQALRGGTNRQVLEHIKANGDIFFAWSDKEWILDGATVHVSFVGFDNGDEQGRQLDGISVSTINSDLTSNVDLSKGLRLDENERLSFQGVVLRGQFNITHEQAAKMLSVTGNPNGRPNTDVIFPRRTGEDIVSQPSDSYVIDFGIDMPIEAASQYVLPFEYLKKFVYPNRQKANQASAREKWWIHWNPRTQMRTELSRLDRYIATPRVAKHRIFVWLEKSILPDAQLVVFARDDDYFFGILQSKVHELWARRLGTQLRDAISGFRYTSTTTFETFPFPWPPGKEPKDDPRLLAIAAAAKVLVEMRDRWLNPEGLSEIERKKRTLTNLYNQRPTWLDLAHRKLDAAVCDAYGWPHDFSDEEILEKLLKLNLERAG